jgi:hypothetical protein
MDALRAVSLMAATLPMGLVAGMFAVHGRSSPGP